MIRALLAVCLLIQSIDPPSSERSSWQDVDRVMGQAGKDQPGGVHRFAWPRTDLAVQIDGVAIEPELALGSWGAFQRMGAEAEVMGDLVLTGTEAGPVMAALADGGFEILAIHNHLINETPRLIYVHYDGRGDAAKLARALKAALGRSATPLAPPAGSLPRKPSAEQEKTLSILSEAVGRKGTMAGRVLQLSIPRVETIRDAGMDVPPAMGMAIAVNFQAAGSRVATTGDFVLLADEVNPVIRELASHGIAATALHSHMLREIPRLFFLHFWAVDAPEKIGAGIRAALAKVATK
ncbi:MAG: DUF1259 domain-containing protein [Acidobacteria bacterium]|nr:DUF1259 domain-containing protein [Acidobacteriota bacterium]MCA1612070.1 DUF1259 domain-containing protein [Acidobacteriota bacterium]